MARLTAQVPKDLNSITSKRIFGFTPRQITWFSVGIAVGFTVFFAFKHFFNMTLLMFIMALFVFPFLFIGVQDGSGVTVESLVKGFIKTQIIQNPVRLYADTSSLNEITAREVTIQRPKQTKKKKKQQKQKKQIKNSEQEIQELQSIIDSIDTTETSGE